MSIDNRIQSLENTNTNHQSTKFKIFSSVNDHFCNLRDATVLFNNQIVLNSKHAMMDLKLLSFTLWHPFSHARQS